MTNEKNSSNQNKWSMDAIAISIFALFWMAFMFYLIYVEGGDLGISMSKVFIPVLIGLIYENRKLGAKWYVIAIKLLVSLFISLLAFTSDIEKMMPFWLGTFIVAFSAISSIIHEEKVIQPLTEGLVLIQSAAMIYWIVDLELMHFGHWSNVVLLVFVGGFSILSIVHALFDIEISRSTRFWLSIWSSIVYLLFSIDYLVRLFGAELIPDQSWLDDIGYFIQYFFLGISSIYMIANYSMLADFMPARNNTREEDRTERKALIEKHIKRYSTKQVKRTDSILAISFSFIMFGLNYHYELLPRITIIWLMLWVFPMIILLKNKLLKSDSDVQKW